MSFLNKKSSRFQVWLPIGMQRHGDSTHTQRFAQHGLVQFNDWNAREGECQTLLGLTAPQVHQIRASSRQRNEARILRLGVDHRARRECRNGRGAYQQVRQQSHREHCDQKWWFFFQQKRQSSFINSIQFIHVKNCATFFVENRHAVFNIHKLNIYFNWSKKKIVTNKLDIFSN